MEVLILDCLLLLYIHRGTISVDHAGDFGRLYTYYIDSWRDPKSKE